MSSLNTFNKIQYSYFGTLGYEDMLNRGDAPGEMGDALPIIDIGSEFSSSGVHLMDGDAYDSGHSCIYEETSTALLLKC